jgi:predicted Fe-Mo cluster-binding NifX family protein
MKIAIPTDGEKGLEDDVTHHFGRALNFVIYDTENKKAKILPNTSEHMGGEGLPPELLRDEEVKVMICSDLGARALEMFLKFGIEVYCGASGLIRDVIEEFKDGKLKKADSNSVCRH